MRGENIIPLQEEVTFEHFVVLVCNVSSEEKTTISQKKIIKGLTQKWKDEANDPDAERLHIIYLSPGDTFASEKFTPLKNLNHRSRIYIVGHCQPGSNAIQSDNVYSLTDVKTKEVIKRYQRHSYTAEFLGKILIYNLNKEDRNLLIRRDHDLRYPENYLLHNMNRRLRICVPSCYSGTDKMDKDGSLVSSSFCHQLLNYLMNEEPYLVKCDVVGALGIVAPIPTEPYFWDFAKFVITRDEPEKETEKGASFHQRQWLVAGDRFATLIPRGSKPEYEPVFTYPSYVNASDLMDSRINVVKLPPLEGKEFLERQVIAQKLLNLCEQVIAEGRQVYGSLTDQAYLLRDKILTGKLPPDSLVKLLDRFELDQQLHRRYTKETEATRIPEDIRKALIDEVDKYIDSRSVRRFLDRVTLDPVLTEQKVKLAKDFRLKIVGAPDWDRLMSLVDDFKAVNSDKESVGKSKSVSRGFDTCLNRVQDILVKYKISLERGPQPKSS